MAIAYSVTLSCPSVLLSKFSFCSLYLLHVHMLNICVFNLNLVYWYMRISRSSSTKNFITELCPFDFEIFWELSVHSLSQSRLDILIWNLKCTYISRISGQVCIWFKSSLCPWTENFWEFSVHSLSVILWQFDWIVGYRYIMRICRSCYY